MEVLILLLEKPNKLVIACNACFPGAIGQTIAL